MRAPSEACPDSSTPARARLSLLYLFPDRGVGIFIVHSQRRGGSFQTMRTDFVRAFAARYFLQVLPAARHDPQAAQRAAGFAGVYRPHLLPPVSLEEIDSGLDRVRDGTNEGLTIAFERDARGGVRGMAMSGSTQDPVSFDHLVWYQRGTLHAALIGAVYLPFVGSTIAEILGRTLRFLLRHRRVIEPPGSRRAWGAAVTAGALMLSAPLSTAVLALTVGLTFLHAGTVVGLALVPISLSAWRKRYWGTARRVYFTTLAIGAIITVPLLLRYHLLGYWF